MAKKLVALLLVLMLTLGGSVLATAEAASTDTAAQTDSIFPLKDEITLTVYVLGMYGITGTPRSLAIRISARFGRRRIFTRTN